jgi:hypothetical protein
MGSIYIPADAELVEAVARPRGVSYTMTADQATWLKGKLQAKNAVGLATKNALKFFGIDPATVKVNEKTKEPRFSRKKAELALATAGCPDVVTRLTNKGSVVNFQHGTQTPPKAPKAKATKGKGSK